MEARRHEPERDDAPHDPFEGLATKPSRAAQPPALLPRRNGVVVRPGETPQRVGRQDLLGILLSAAFKRREAATLIRIVSEHPASYVLLVNSASPNANQQGNIDRQLLRKRFELGLLSLHRDQCPHTLATARELANVRASEPVIIR